MALIYKIVPQALWRESTAEGVFRGAPVDLADGFMHFSTAEQVADTAERHFAGARDLMLVAADTATLGDALRWESSRGGALFPHLYAALPHASVTSVRPLPVAVDGRHNFGGLLP